MTASTPITAMAGGDAQVVVDTAIAATEPTPLDPGTTYSVVVPAGASQQQIRTDYLLPAPTRTKGTVTLHDVSSLAAFVNHYGATAIYADAPRRAMTAVVNGPTVEGPGWADHRAQVTLRHTPEWSLWANRSGQLGDQVKLAELIEDRIVDIVEPDGATMLELAQSFEASSSARFKSGQRLNSGERQFVYEETVEARAGRRGDLVVPERFTLLLSVFVGEEPVEVHARLRYRVSDGDLRIGFVIDRLDDLLRRAFDAAVASLEDALDGEALGEMQPLVYRGEAPSTP